MQAPRSALPGGQFIFKTAFCLSVLSVALSRASAGQPTDAELDLFLQSVDRRAQEVLVSNDAGIFRAELDDKQWKKLDLPAQMRAGGTFGKVPVGSPQILYFTNRNQRHQDRQTAGLYGSRDSGQTWQLLLESDEINEVLMLSSGDLFIVRSEQALGFNCSIEVSGDLGKSWKDITGKCFGSVSQLFPDPDHPGLVCVRTNLIRGYVLQAEDSRYQWKAMREWQWHPELADKMLFGRSYSTGTTNNPLYMFCATLQNYFEYEFGSLAQIHSMDLRADKDQFVFQQGQAVEIPLTVRFLINVKAESAPVEEKLIDHPSQLGVWGLRVQHGDERTYREPAISAAMRKIRDDDFAARIRGEPGRRAELEAEFIRSQRGSDGWQTIDLGRTKPYRRLLNLSQLYEFDEPGEYRVQLDYTSDWIGDRGRGHWVGSFSSPVFTVTIRPRD